MPLIQVLVYAIIQGITELLPVSSTAHLAILPWIVNWPDPGLTFDVALHMGTLAAVGIYFFKTWIDVLLHDRRLLGLMILATIPAGVAGLLFEHHVETTLRTPYVIAASSIIMALAMAAAERVARTTREMKEIGLTDSLTVGFAQALALIPGVSRSGVTITAGLFRDLRRDASARFSFLLSTPLIAGAGLKKAMELRHTGVPAEMKMPFLVGMAVSGLVGYAVIALFLKYLQTHTLKIFVYYRLLFGIIILVLAILSRPR
jgi:undecaprenyl-diphosphatase